MAGAVSVEQKGHDEEVPDVQGVGRGVEAGVDAPRRGLEVRRQVVTTLLGQASSVSAPFLSFLIFLSQLDVIMLL